MIRVNRSLPYYIQVGNIGLEREKNMTMPVRLRVYASSLFPYFFYLSLLARKIKFKKNMSDNRRRYGARLQQVKKNRLSLRFFYFVLKYFLLRQSRQKERKGNDIYMRVSEREREMDEVLKS